MFTKIVELKELTDTNSVNELLAQGWFLLSSEHRVYLLCRKEKFESKTTSEIIKEQVLRYEQTNQE